MSKKLSFGEEIFLEENNLGEKDEVAIILCEVCGLSLAAGCIFTGCDGPLLFAAGLTVAPSLLVEATATGAVISA